MTALGDGTYFILNNIALQDVLIGSNEVDGWDQILPFVQDYAYDLILAQARSADVIASDVNSYIASERIDLSINRALQTDAQKSSFEEFAFDKARPFREAFNSGRISLSESLKLIDETAKFRSWLCGHPPEADIVKEFHRAVSKDTRLGKFPAKAARFAVFTGPGVALDVMGAGGIGTITGVALSAIDSFVMDGLLRGWRPNHFVAQVRKALPTAEDD
jgi:hypothetical protein